jgi:hypothetical protein
MVLFGLHLVTAGLLAADPPAAPATGTLVFDPGASEVIEGYFGALEQGLLKVLGGEARAVDVLGPLGQHPEQFRDQVRNFGDQARQLGAIAEPRITGFEVEATLWYGIVPMGKVQLFFWRQGKELRLLRWSGLGEADLHFFDRGAAPRWREGPGLAMGKVARQVLDAGTRGACGELPVVRDEDLPPVLPKDEAKRAKTFVHLDRFRRRVAEQCGTLFGTPFDHVTWRFGEAGGVLKSADGEVFSFRVSLTPGADGQIALDLLTAPVAP